MCVGQHRSFECRSELWKVKYLDSLVLGDFLFNTVALINVDIHLDIFQLLKGIFLWSGENAFI